MAKKEGKRVVVSKPALMARINRKLAKEGQRLYASRSPRSRLDFGDFYTVDLGTNFVAAAHLELEALGRELGVLKPYEQVEEA